MKKINMERLSRVVEEVLTKCYAEALSIKIELEDGNYFYVDGQIKQVWSSKTIPKRFWSADKYVERVLQQLFINNSKTYPLILFICPDDNSLPGMFNLIDCFENVPAKQIIRATIFDWHWIPLKKFEGFDQRKRYFITMLRQTQYKGIESFKIQKEFMPLKLEMYRNNRLEKGLARVAEAEYVLKGYDSKSGYSLRVALVKELIEGKEKLFPIITNLRKKEEPNVARIARRYFDRWPSPEFSFKDMMKTIKCGEYPREFSVFKKDEDGR